MISIWKAILMLVLASSTFSTIYSAKLQRQLENVNVMRIDTDLDSDVNLLSNLLAQPQGFKNEGSTINFDDSLGLERQFEGIGGLSGGGATSKLLVNYPEIQRNEILDYLFKPNFGASLQILKVEIGGDSQSTDGTEASHMHNSNDENYERGYEWWLMLEAKKRNPNIKLYGLPWAFPGWIGQGTQNPYTNVSLTADYIIRWISGAKRMYNLTIDYIGIWNERNYNVAYIKTLRNALDLNGFQNVLIVASDGGWDIAHDILNDGQLANAVYAIGCHYPGTYDSQDAYNTGKSLWASEDYSTYNDEIGGGCWARILNQNYVNGYMSSTISWNLIGSYYYGLPFYRDGLMTAVEPWSGNYNVSTPIWITAHTTQFTSIGWRYLKHDSGVGKLPQGGSYVGLVSPDGTDLTIVIETMTHDHSICIRPGLPWYDVHPQLVTLNLKGSFARLTSMNVWYSKLGFNGQPDIMFQSLGQLKFVSGQAVLKLGLDEVYTLTTISTGQKGSYPVPPPSQPFPLPYLDDFEGYPLYQEPFNLAQQTGSYEVLSDGQTKFIRQMVLENPVAWCDSDLHNKSISVVGSYTWSDIFVEINFRIPTLNSTSGVFVAARVDQGGCDAFKAQGIYLYVLQSGAYQLSNDFARTKITQQGSVQISAGWHTLSLLVQGASALGALDGVILFNATIPTSPASGFAAIGTDSYGLADFDNLLLESAASGLKIMGKYTMLVK
ncbi:galactocerebrosidase-like [Biomphalaria glabrata]|uniref:galactosylceramidase n=1 Tax=Biomphalaria glabrata TaxID=6526 RepID=A0A9W3B522_BIOGL|nr:galactocerebrosidase-like [Biomphalaria glabrata]XP_055894560.1 galactocerebrosidase-like [Biomphalaria glabrata]XP_055894637.1 galactocerebrosidase-like [Biomphalaria glabrata]XP_055894726.1 galactocerebrosidase-like [Biomphalaria glabrata]